MFSQALCATFLLAAPLSAWAQSPLSVGQANAFGSCSGVVPSAAAAGGNRVVFAFDEFRAVNSSRFPLGSSASCNVNLEVSTLPGYSAGLLNVRYQGSFLSSSLPQNAAGQATFARRVGLFNNVAGVLGPVRTTTYESGALIEDSDLGAEFAVAGPATGSQSIELQVDLNALGEGSAIGITAIELEFAVFNSLGQLVTE